MNGLKKGWWLGAAFGLAGCAAGPSEEDAKGAFVREFDRAFAGGAKVQEVRDFQLSACQAADKADGYTCDVRGEVVLNIAGSQVPRPLKGHFRFSNASGQWEVYQ